MADNKMVSFGNFTINKVEPASGSMSTPFNGWMLTKPYPDGNYTSINLTREDLRDLNVIIEHILERQ
jgi:hypothetical protein